MSDMTDLVTMVRRGEDLVMSAEDENRRQWQQAQYGVAPWREQQWQQHAPPGYSPISEADVQRIAAAVVLRLRAEADYLR